jgi:hypothetical protein
MRRPLPDTGHILDEDLVEEHPPVYVKVLGSPGSWDDEHGLDVLGGANVVRHHCLALRHEDLCAVCRVGTDLYTVRGHFNVQPSFSVRLLLPGYNVPLVVPLVVPCQMYLECAFNVRCPES